MHKMSLQDRFYNLLKSGDKTIELRLYDAKRAEIKIGEILEFSNSSNDNDRFTARVVGLHKFSSFEALCENIDCKICGFSTNAELISVMAAFYTLDLQKQLGVVGIEIKIEN
jgi:ASC-1-like (ASCH) protein